jgi:hypothetical protein
MNLSYLRQRTGLPGDTPPGTSFPAMSCGTTTSRRQKVCPDKVQQRGHAHQHGCPPSPQCWVLGEGSRRRNQRMLPRRHRPFECVRSDPGQFDANGGRDVVRPIDPGPGLGPREVAGFVALEKLAAKRAAIRRTLGINRAAALVKRRARLFEGRTARAREDLDAASAQRWERVAGMEPHAGEQRPVAAEPAR